MPAHLTTLGTVSVQGDGSAGADSVLAQPKRLALLGYLVVQGRGRWVSRQDLVGLFWPDLDEIRARKALSQSLWVLRSELGDTLIQKRGAADVALSEDALTVDLWRFLDALDRGDDRAAVEAYGGEFLPGLVVGGCPAFERWLEEQRGALRRLAREAGWRVAEEAHRTGDLTGAVRWAQGAYRAAGPYDEDALRRLMGYLGDAGDPVGALEIFEALRRELAADDDEPHPTTQALAETLRASPPPVEPAPARAATRRPPPPPAVEGPGGAGGHPGPRRRSRIASPLGLAAVVFLMSVAVAMALGFEARSDRASPEADRYSRIAVLPFTLDGSPELAYLETAVVDLLSARLDGAGDLSSVDPAAVLAVPRTLRPADVRRRLGADLTVTGSWIALGTSLEVRAVLTDPSGLVLHQARATATAEEDISRALDELALSLLTGLLEDGPSSLDYGAAQETGSLPALRAYLRGEAAFRSFRLEEAIDAFREAVALDSAFALAYFRLNRLGDWLEDGQLVSALDDALVHRERLPRRHARLLEAHVQFWRASAPEGIRLLEDAAASYPTDADAWFQLGDARFHGGPRLGRNILQSEGPFRRALELNPRDHRAALHLVGLAAYRRDQAEARRLSALFRVTDPARRFQVTALSLPADSPLEALAAALDSLPLSQFQAVLSVVDFLERPDLLIEAGRRLERDGGTPELRIQGLSYQILGSEAAGRAEEAAASVARLASLDPVMAQGFERYLASLPWRARNPATTHPATAAGALRSSPLIAAEGILALRAGLEARFDSIRASAGAATDRWAEGVIAILEAEAALERGRPTEGIEVLEAVRSRRNALTDFPTLMTMPHASERFLRGRLLEAAGRYEEALDWYGTMAAPVSYSILYAAPAHEARARILTRLGRIAEAEEASSRARHIRS